MFQGHGVKLYHMSFKDTCKSTLKYDAQCRLSAWARWAVALPPHEHSGPMLICVCCIQHIF